MEALKSSFVSTTTPFQTPPYSKSKSSSKTRTTTIFFSSVTPDPWTLSDGNNKNKNIIKPKPKSKNPKNPLSDDNARRIIKAKAQYLSALRRNQGSHAQTPKWIKRTPEQMVQYLEDDRNGHLYGKHVVAAIQQVRSLSGRPEGSYNMRVVMGSFVAKLSFKEMCIVLKEQKGWRQARDFFLWMKLQLSYRPSVIVYTILLRIYGQVGKIKLAEQTFLEMLEAGCEPDEVACGTMLCAYARWGRHKAMLSFYSAVKERGVMLSIAVFNFMLSSLQKKSLHRNVTELWKQMVDKGVVPNHFTYTVVISSFVKEGLAEEAFKTFNEMKNLGFVPEEVTYSLLISSSCKNGNQDDALRLYEDMRSRGIVASNYTCASLLTLHYKSGDYSKALSLFSEMERNKIAADEVIYGLLIRIYGKLGLYEDAQRTFEEIEKLGLLSDEKTYITMAQVHLYSGYLEKALSTMEQMSSRNIWFSRFGFIVLLQCYVMKEDLASAEVTYEALSKTGLPDTGSCNNMLNLYLRLRLTEKAKDFVMQMRKDKVEFDEELLKTVLKVYCKEGMVGDAEQLIEEMSTGGHFEDSKFIQTFSMLMHGQSRRPNKAEDSLERLDQPVAIAFKLILTLYSAAGNSSKTEEILKLLIKTANGLSIASQLVNKLIKEGEISKAECLYKLLIELGRIPEHVTSASMISFYGKQQKLKQALEVFQMAAGSPTNAKPLYNSMIDAYAKSGKPEAAYLFYREASEEGQDLGAVAISMLVNALINGGKYREAENVIHGSFRDNLELDTVAYNTFIKAMLKAASLYEHMLSSGVVPSIQTYSIMISVYGRGRNLNKAVEMFNTARSMGVSLDEKAYTNLICYYGKAGKVHEASFLFGKMQEEGIKPGKVSYNIMMNVYATAGLHCETKELFLAMQKDGCLPDSLTYLALVQAYTLGLKYSEAEDAIISMQKVGFPASCAHFNLLLSAFVKAGLIQEAERVYGELISTAGLSPDLACCRTMLRGYMDYGHVKEGISLFESIRECVEPDRFIMSAAVHLYKSVGMELRADQILNSMDSLAIPFLKNLKIGSKTKAPQVSELI
ncbi:pentatricopeptide repeat-containing protein At5g27270 isoform X2 [Camellia sinensis]|uniref:PROP1-like PPR domain-containing protein n=1 Tax=Camellia sinensis var. sinensis TaxID=542762 RepID=A0A4S4E228_CAMSN|nr:pentatricopeptide repeat-containing protein At5g27270 isoform X2 [Camellia sinensis]THG09889.1 hypothetical protein TEA_008708 [Camellia sinensis var. sinensis]